MRRLSTVLTLGLASLGVASAALAQSTPPASRPAPTPTSPAPATATPPPGAFATLAPGDQKIALALCTAQPGGCPSATPNPSAPSLPLTREQIAAMKAHRGWGAIFKQMQQTGQIPADVKNLGQLVSGRYQAPAGSAGITITTASGKSQGVGTSGGQGGHGPVKDDPSISSAGGHANPGGGHSNANSHGGGHGE